MKLGIFIPGRLKSERLPNKLILPLGESSLWEIACNKLNKLPKKYNKYVLCNDKELIDIAIKYENLQIIVRDKNTCNVDGPMTYIFKELKDLEDTHLMFLNPCLYNLSKETIEYNLKEFERRHMDYATSAKVIKNWIFNDNSRIVNEIDYKTLNTKTIKPWYQAAHCFHVFNRVKFFEDGYMLKENHNLLHVEDEDTLDVDTEKDYIFAKWFIENN